MSALYPETVAVAYLGTYSYYGYHPLGTAGFTWSRFKN